MASRLKDDVAVNRITENEDLLVFGYSCKLFRDDEKALYIDQGKHLIPWMGDEALKIDRYDARGTLFDLKQVEAPSGGFDRFFGLTDMERQVESMCDEERYRALVANEEEETMYQEEELKRLHYAIGDKGNSYGQVEYKYDGETNSIADNTEKPQIEKTAALDGAEDELFVPSPQLDLPLNMVLPETVKHNAIIEKTAMFISNQGPQMEILLKMKQAGNPQFNFLSFDNPLHSYYRHLLLAIKDGRYNPDFENSNKKTEMENDEDDHYLHPSLASSVSKVELAPSIPSINYKPSAHCAYSMLVNKIKDKKSNDQATHLTKLKEALESLTEDKGTEKESDNKRFHRMANQNSKIQPFPTPPREMQIIIDKMAFYVIKNGRDFEAVVQTKNDPRFDFLNAAHIFNCYYQYKIKQYEDIEKSSKLEMKVKADNPNLKLREEHSKNKLAPVCFSIKKPKDSEPVIEKSALPVEESSDEEKDDREVNATEEREREGKEEVVTIDLAALEEKEEKNKKILAAERIKDKLTAAAREKVAMATKEKQLQLDRKRRAAAFLRAINSDGKSSAPSGALISEGTEKETEGGSDVASLPDVPEELDDDKEERPKRAEDSRQRFGKPSGGEHEKLNRSSHPQFRRLKHREKKRRSKMEKPKKKYVDVERIKDHNDRIAESSPSSEEDTKRGFFTDKARKSEESSWKKKFVRNSTCRSDEKKHKKKKHKKDDVLDRGSRKHSKLKREKRNKNDLDARIVKVKRSRRDSTSSSNPNS